LQTFQLSKIAPKTVEPGNMLLVKGC